MTYKVLTVPHTILFSNKFLEDLDKIWELRHWIPDPTKPIIYKNRCPVRFALTQFYLHYWRNGGGNSYSLSYSLSYSPSYSANH